MKAKSLLKLFIVLLLIVVVSYLALNGAEAGKYILKPVGRAISLGLDLRGGVSTEYIVTDTNIENYEYMLDNTIKALRERLTSAGFTEATVSIRGTDRILVEIPDVDDPEQVAEIIGTPAHLEVRDPLGNVVFEGKDIEKADAIYVDESGTRAGVSFELNKTAAAAFENATREFIGQSISFYLDDEMISDPVVNEVISGGTVMITGDEQMLPQETVEWAQDLVMLIQSGALPLDIAEVETRAISATLGIEAIDGALIAGVVGLAVIMLFMLIVYRLPGLAADMALLIYILIVFYAMAIIGVQLTLQGVAGILLGIGMAVDANVVIFERFREELAEGRTPESAVKFGFRNAGRAVADSNITTLIAAVVLMIFGTGTIKGFAITLLISVLASLFTAVVVTRWLLRTICRLEIKNIKAYTRAYGKKEKKALYGKPRIFLAVSGLVVVAALVMQLAGAGMNLGVDFTGGSLLHYSVGEDYDVADVEKILASAGYTGSQITKIAPSDAETEAEFAGETAENTAEIMLDLDKSGIEADGLTDLMIRLNLVDETAGLDQAVANAVAGAYPDAEMRSYGTLSKSRTVNYGFESEFAGAKLVEIEIGEAFDAEALVPAIEAALAEYSVENIQLMAYDPAAEGDAEAEGTALRVAVRLDDQEARIRALLEEQMSAKYPSFRFVSIDHVSAIAGRDLLGNAVKALLIAFACMLVYIAIRFDVFSGLAALFGLLHDVLVMCAFMVFFRGAFQVNSSFIAAILTIVGYSINNTIIVFDRIRETAKKPDSAKLSRREVVGHAVRHTLSRTINTSLTTLITLVALYVFGVESIREFAFPLIVGMLAGTYSSVLLSGQVWAMWMDKLAARKVKRA